MARENLSSHVLKRERGVLERCDSKGKCDADPEKKQGTKKFQGYGLLSQAR